MALDTTLLVLNTCNQMERLRELLKQWNQLLAKEGDPLPSFACKYSHKTFKWVQPRWITNGCKIWTTLSMLPSVRGEQRKDEEELWLSPSHVDSETTSDWRPCLDNWLQDWRKSCWWVCVSTILCGRLWPRWEISVQPLGLGSPPFSSEQKPNKNGNNQQSSKSKGSNCQEETTRDRQAVSTRKRRVTRLPSWYRQD